MIKYNIGVNMKSIPMRQFQPRGLLKGSYLSKKFELLFEKFRIFDGVLNAPVGIRCVSPPGKNGTLYAKLITLKPDFMGYDQTEGTIHRHDGGVN